MMMVVCLVVFILPCILACMLVRVGAKVSATMVANWLVAPMPLSCLLSLQYVDQQAVAECRAKLQRRKADLDSVRTFLASLSEAERQGQGVESVEAEVAALEQRLATLERRGGRAR